MKIFTVNHTWRSMDDYKSSTTTLGVFLSEEDARACLKKQRDEELSDSYKAWMLEGVDGEGEDDFCGHIECDEKDYFEVEYDYHKKYDIIEVEQKELDGTPSAILAALRKSMQDDIERRAEAVVPGYSSARKAVIDLRDEHFHTLSFANNNELIKVEAFIGMVGLAVIVRCADGVRRNGLVKLSDMSIEELLELHSVITNSAHTTRACNPLWFGGYDWHVVLMDILYKTEEEFEEMIKKNPKNKK